MTSKEERDKLDALERSEGWKLIMSTPASRRVMWDHFEIAGIYQATPGLDAQTMAWNEGRRSLALQTMNDMLNYCPDLYDRMTVENRARLSLQKTEDALERDQ